MVCLGTRGLTRQTSKIDRICINMRGLIRLTWMRSVFLKHENTDDANMNKKWLFEPKSVALTNR